MRCKMEDSRITMADFGLLHSPCCCSSCCPLPPSPMQLPRTPYTNTSRQKEHGRAHAAGTHFPRVLSRRRCLPGRSSGFPSWGSRSLVSAGRVLQGAGSADASHGPLALVPFTGRTLCQWPRPGRGARARFGTAPFRAVRLWCVPWFPPVRGGSGFCRRCRAVRSWLRGLLLSCAHLPFVIYFSASAAPVGVGDAPASF